MSEEELSKKVIDRIFGVKKLTFYILVAFFVALIARIIAAINLSVAADDMHFVTHAINFFSSGRLVTYDQSSGLWFAFTSIIYKIFGYSQFSSRFAAILFGSFSVIILFLLTREFFNGKIALIAAFLLALAPFHIKNTVSEMDVMAMFFVLTSMLLFVYGLKREKLRYYAISGIFLGLAVYTKVYPLLFVPSLLIYFAYFKHKNKQKILNKRNIKLLLYFLFTVFIFAIPALTHNYLLYQDKGIMDIQFTRTLGLGKDVSAQYYSWDPIWGAKNDWKGFFFGNSKYSPGSSLPSALIVSNFVFFASPIIFILGVLGILSSLIYRKQYRKYLYFFVIMLLFVFPFLASIMLLPKHYLFLELLLIPFAALIISEAGQYISRVYKKNGIRLALAVVLILSLLYLGSAGFQPIGIDSYHSLPHFYGKSAIGQAIDFKNSEIEENALIVADSRFYRGRVHWMSYERDYLEGTEFITLVNPQTGIGGVPINVEVYYFECVYDDCGWGGIQNQPEFNQSQESLTDFFKQNGALVKEISEPAGEKLYFPVISSGNKVPAINIYKTRLSINSGVIQAAQQPKSWFLYNVGYEQKESAFDYYFPITLFQILLDKIAHWIVLFALIAAFLSPIYVVYLYIKRK